MLASPRAGLCTGVAWLGALLTAPRMRALDLACGFARYTRRISMALFFACVGAGGVVATARALTVAMTCALFPLGVCGIAFDAWANTMMPARQESVADRMTMEVLCADVLRASYLYIVVAAWDSLRNSVLALYLVDSLTLKALQLSCNVATWQLHVSHLRLTFLVAGYPTNFLTRVSAAVF